MEQDADGGFYQLIESLLADTFKFAQLVPRVAKHLEEANYLSDVEEIVELSDQREELLNHTHKVIEQVCEYRNTFSKYTYLWVDNREEFLQQFLLYGHILTTEELEAAGEEGVVETPPTLEKFKSQIDDYEKIHTEVVSFEVCTYLPWKIGCVIVCV